MQFKPIYRSAFFAFPNAPFDIEKIQITTDGEYVVKESSIFDSNHTVRISHKIKIRAEHPDSTACKVHADLANAYDAFDAESCIKNSIRISLAKARRYFEMMYYPSEITNLVAAKLSNSLADMALAQMLCRAITLAPKSIKQISTRGQHYIIKFAEHHLDICNGIAKCSCKKSKITFCEHVLFTLVKLLHVSEEDLCHFIIDWKMIADEFRITSHAAAKIIKESRNYIQEHIIQKQKEIGKYKPNPEKSEDVCTICLECLCNSADVVSCPFCKNNFHCKCIVDYYTCTEKYHCILCKHADVWNEFAEFIDTSDS
jgi:hypothetical protein